MIIIHFLPWFLPLKSSTTIVYKLLQIWLDTFIAKTIHIKMHYLRLAVQSQNIFEHLTFANVISTIYFYP